MDRQNYDCQDVASMAALHSKNCAKDSVLTKEFWFIVVSCCCMSHRIDLIVLLARQRTCDSQVAGLSPGWAPSRSGLGQATYTCVPLSPSSIICYRPSVVIPLAGKVTASLVESNDSLPPGLWLMSPVDWLSRNRDQLHAQCMRLPTLLYTCLVDYLFVVDVVL